MTRGTFSLGMTLKVIAVTMLAIYLSSPVTPARALTIDYSYTGDITGTATIDWGDFAPPFPTTPFVKFNLFTPKGLFQHPGITLTENSLTQLPGSRFGARFRLEVDQGIFGFAQILSLTDRFEDEAGASFRPFDGGPLEIYEVTIASSTPVPEPNTLLLFGSGLMGLAGYRWAHGYRKGAKVS